MTPDKKDEATKHWTRVFICELESVLKYKGNWFFISLVATGLGMSAYAYLGFSLGYLDSDMLVPLVIDGVAFLVVGVVGLIMSRTTQKIGEEIKGILKQNTEQLEAIASSTSDMSSSMNNMNTSITTSMDGMKDTLGEILKELQNRNGHKPTGKPA